MPPEDTSYYDDLNPSTIWDQFDLPQTFTVEKRDGRLVLYSGEELGYYIVIDEDSDVSPGDEVDIFEEDGKILTSVQKETQYGKREIEPGVYEITGTKGPGDKVSSPQEIRDTPGAPLPDSDRRPGDKIDPIEFPTLNEPVDQSGGAPNHADRQYQEYLEGILENGHESGDRTGTGTIKSFGHQMKFDLTEGFPLLTSKAISFENVARELLWFLRGQTNIWHLLKKGVDIWTGNAYERYREDCWREEQLLTEDEFVERILEDDNPDKLDHTEHSFAKTWGDLGEIYGERWRNADGFDQIENLIEQLQKNPDSRRLRVDAWSPRVHMKGAPNEYNAGLPPCHCSFEVFTRELSVEERKGILRQDRPVIYGTAYGPPADLLDSAPGPAFLDSWNVPRRALSLKWNQRSVDSFLGLPYNIASYGLLTHLLAHRVNMVPEEVIFSGGDCHVYQNHLDQVEELLSRVPKANLPTLTIGWEKPPEDMGDYQFEDLSIEGYDPHPPIEAPLAT